MSLKNCKLFAHQPRSSWNPQTHTFLANKLLSSSAPQPVRSLPALVGNAIDLPGKGGSSEGQGLRSIIQSLQSLAVQSFRPKLLVRTGGYRKLLFAAPSHADWRPPTEYATTPPQPTSYSVEMSGSKEAGSDEEKQKEDEEDGVLVYSDCSAPHPGQSNMLEASNRRLESPPMPNNERTDPAIEARLARRFERQGIEESSAHSQADAIKDTPAHKRRFSTKPLVFESRFESGNLRSAVQSGDYEYKLMMREDVCSSACGGSVPNCTQWFYFQVKGVKQGMKYDFSIINMIKTESLYSHGLRPLLFSKKEEASTGKGWHRVGEEISYHTSEKKFVKGGQLHSFQTLRFIIVFPHDDDECYIASCYPYTYTDVQKHLYRLSTDNARAAHFQSSTLCHTMAGNICDIVTICNCLRNAEELRKRPAIVLTARVHPGETGASYMMHGVLEYLTGLAYYAQILRDTHVIYVVPMLNPDGVILGNYRCNLSGQDLNRQYMEPSKDMHPEIFHLKRLLSELASQNRLQLFCDLHGHSSKKGVFLYSCDEALLALPQQFARRSAFFSLQNCTFKVSKQKQCTGRAVVYNEFNCPNSFTCEASFLGADVGGGSQCVHFNGQHLKNVGAQLCESIFEFLLPDKFQDIGAPHGWN